MRELSSFNHSLLSLFGISNTFHDDI